jgi:enhancing lycopene biosynthesis protein 2
MARVAVILAGCGFHDGSEVHESVLTLLALSQAGHTYNCFAPDVVQHRVVNHLTGKEVGETRNTLVEAARIARGEIEPLSQLVVDEFDAVMIPGGFGVALNLSSFGEDGKDCSVDAELKRVVLEMHAAKKPVGATCISPGPIAKVFEGVASVQMTLGSDPATVSQLDAMGAKGVSASVTEMVADETNKVYTTPCYMEPPDLAGCFEGIQKVVAALG